MEAVAKLDCPCLSARHGIFITIGKAARYRPKSLCPENGILAIYDTIEAEVMHTRLDTFGEVSRTIIALLDTVGPRAMGMRLIEQTINKLAGHQHKRL